MAITSATTFDQALAQFNDSVEGWRSSLTKASALLAAIEWMLLNREQLSKVGHTELSFESLEKLRGDVAAFVTKADPAIAAAIASGQAAANRTYFAKARILGPGGPPGAPGGCGWGSW